MTVTSWPGPVLFANYVATNAIVNPVLGRNLTGASNATVNLIAPGTMYGDRMNTMDLRLAKIFRFGTTRSSVTVDVYNLWNRNPVQQYNNNFSSWLTPQRILQARFMKLGVQFDF